MSVRAVRNNNPGNIRIGAPWFGLQSRDHMTPEQAAETQFCVFSAPQWGFRAMATIFLTYARKDGVKTIRQAISRWAPPTENNTTAYVNDVCKQTGFDPDAIFNFSNPTNMRALCRYVSVHECGGWFFSLGDLMTGVEAAL